MINIEHLTNSYFSKYEPCPYKLKIGIEILIYPILVKDCMEYDLCKTVLMIDKRNFADAKILQMSQLEFLFNLFETEDIGKNEFQKFKHIFSLCLKEDYVAITKNDEGKYIIVVAEKKDEDIILKYTISNKEFMDISKIILFQNDASYTDEYINPDVLKEYNEMIELKTKGFNNPTLEQKKVFVLSRYGCKFQEIEEMPYRLFDLLYSEYINIEQYFIDNMYKTAYKYDIKDNLIYPLFRKEDKFKDLFLSTNTLNNKLGN